MLLVFVFVFIVYLTFFLQVQIESVERFAFYDRAKTAFAIVHTGWFILSYFFFVAYIFFTLKVKRVYVGL